MERITLYRNGHEDESPSYADVLTWINKLFSIEFKCQDILAKQMENAKYELSNGGGFISIKFCVSNTVEKFPFKVRIPVEMVAFQQDRHPIMFLLHVVDGFVEELEIYTADGSAIDGEISVLNVEHKVADILKFDK